MASYPRVKTTEQIRSLFQKVATTNHYEVFFNGFASLQSLRGHITTNAPLVSNFFISRDLGLLCNSAELPGTSMATAQIEGNRMGIVEKFAHTRVYTDTTLTFYVDSDYRVVQFFELWHDFIASGSGVSKDQKAYYNRLRYPDEYKVSTMRIQKFNKDHFRNVEYTFLNAFPVNVSSMPVSYDGANVLELQVTFAYDRYYFGKLTSLNSTSKDLQDNGGAIEIRTPEAVGNGQFKDNKWAKGPLQNAYNDGKLTEQQYEYLTHEKPKGVYGPTDIINNDMA